MNIARLIFNVIAVISIVFFIFHIKDVLGFWVVSIKKICIGIYRLIKGLIKK